MQMPQAVESTRNCQKSDTCALLRWPHRKLCLPAEMANPTASIRFEATAAMSFRQQKLLSRTERTPQLSRAIFVMSLYWCFQRCDRHPCPRHGRLCIANRILSVLGEQLPIQFPYSRTTGWSAQSLYLSMLRYVADTSLLALIHRSDRRGIRRHRRVRH